MIYNKEITLLEALTGVDFVLTHLDGRKIRVKSAAGEVIKPDDIKTLIGLGMPFYKKSYEFGNMFVKFSIVFPKEINSTTESASLKEVLGQCPNQKVEEVKEGAFEEEQHMTQLIDAHKNTHAAGGKVEDQEDEDEDDEEGSHGGQRVGCQQQ